MKRDKYSFLHESLQDAGTIEQLLESVSRGLGKGKLVLSDEDDEIVLKPQGLLNLKVSACQEEGNNRVTIRITWQSEQKRKKRKKHLTITEK
jgi:amphi-Trp domain-containing protein